MPVIYIRNMHTMFTHASRYGTYRTHLRARTKPQIPLYCQVARTNRESADPWRQNIVVPTGFSGRCHHGCAMEIFVSTRRGPASYAVSISANIDWIAIKGFRFCSLLQYKFDRRCSIIFAQFFAHSYSDDSKKIILRWLMSKM